MTVSERLQIDHAIRARFLVEEIDILGDDTPHVPACLHPSDGVVALVGRDVTHEPVTHVVAGPVVAAECLRTHELLVRHRRAGRGVGAPVIGDAGVGGEPRAGEYRELPPLQKRDRRTQVRRSRSMCMHPSSVSPATAFGVIAGNGYSKSR